MKKIEVLDSIALKKRFCKDAGLPITVFDNPYFYDRVEALDCLFDSVNKFHLFCKMMENFKDEQSYFTYANDLKSLVISEIKASMNRNTHYNEDDFSTEYVCGKKDLYIEENNHKNFISIDMKQANFSALRLYDPYFFGGIYLSWEDYISRFTAYDHLIHSKHFRQVIFGECNPKKQMRLEHYYMNNLCKKIIYDLHANIYSLTEDEILIEIPTDGGLGFSIKDLKDLINSTNMKNCVRVEPFVLEKLHHIKGWAKSYYGNGFDRMEYKCVDAEIFVQVAKWFEFKPISANDLVFYHNGRLAKYLNRIPDPFVE